MLCFRNSVLFLYKKGQNLKARGVDLGGSRILTKKMKDMIFSGGDISDFYTEAKALRIQCVKIYPVELITLVE